MGFFSCIYTGKTERVAGFMVRRKLELLQATNAKIISLNHTHTVSSSTKIKLNKKLPAKADKEVRIRKLG